MNKSTLLFFGILVTGLTLLALFFSYRSYMNNVSLQWLPVEATVTYTDISVWEDEDGDSYTPIVHYSYRDRGGENYFGSRVAFFSVEKSERYQVERVLAEYPLGKIVTAYYNPDNPSQAILKKAGLVSRLPLLQIFLLIPLTAFYIWRLKMHQEIAQARNFRRARGIILESTYEVRDSDAANNTNATVRYGFLYEGKKYAGKRIGYQAMHDITHGVTTKDAETLVTRYPKGKEVTVYVNPQDVRDTVLEPQPAAYQVFLLWLAGGSVTIVATAVAVILLKSFIL